MKNNNASRYISYEEFNKEYRRVNIRNEIDSLNKERSRLYNLQYKYAKDIFLWYAYHETLASDIMRPMNEKQFENLVEQILIILGYQTERTKASYDHGVDIVAIDRLGNRIAIQVKQHSAKVGISAVQEVNTGRALYRCHRAWVVTNSTFTSNAEYVAMINGVQLIDGEALFKMCKGKLPIISENNIPEFDKNKFKEIEQFAERVYIFSKSVLENIYTPYDSELKRLDNEVNRLYKIKVELDKI